MPAIVTRLRIAGFKSFAEPTSIDILPGLTGIVGPNGCGKSNVVEALRWAMGETSPRNLRGGEMDEVIFAGSAGRPARDIAEVVVTLDEAVGLAPPPLSGEAELQVSRQIARGSGSTYRVNGKPARARDVQTMFADIASGARSSAMVSQGRVAALVDARPDERRAVLEEAAGITGLHARRQEAEIRLRAAEANLARVGDLRGSLAAQHASLSRQAEAARAYRTVIEALADAERGLLGVVLGRAVRARDAAGAALERARAGAGAAEQAAWSAAEDERRAEAEAGSLGEEVSGATAALERARGLVASLEAEVARAADGLRAAEARLMEVGADAARAARELEMADLAVVELEDEDAALRDVLGRFDARLAEAEAALTRAVAAAERQAARELAAGELATATAAFEAAAGRLEVAERAMAGCVGPGDDALRAADKASEAAVAAWSEAGARLEAAEQAARAASMAREVAERSWASCRDGSDRAGGRRDDARARRDRLAAELAGLSAREAAARAALLAPGSVARAAAAAAARDSVEEAEVALQAAERARADASDAATRARTEAEAARARAMEAGLGLSGAVRERQALQERYDSLLRAFRAAQAGLIDAAVLTQAEAAVEAARVGLAEAGARAEAAEARRERALTEAASCRVAIASRQAAIGAAEAEIGALVGVAAQDGPSLLDAMRVPEACERAMASALADGLSASLDPDAPRRWVDLGALPGSALPDGVVALAELVEAPAALGRALGWVGLMADGVDGAALLGALAPGQMLVGRDGSMFRWDGLVVRGDQPSPLAERLRARRRVAACKDALAEAHGALPALEASLARWVSAADEAGRALVSARGSVRDGERALSAALARGGELSASALAARSRAEAAEAALAGVAAGLAEAAGREEAASRRVTPEAVLEALARTAGEAAAEAETAARAEQRARDGLYAAQSMQSEMETEALRLAAREEDAAAALATLTPSMGRLSDELAQAEAALAQAEAACVAASAGSEAAEVLLSAAVAATESAGAALVDDRAVRATAEVALELARAEQAGLAEQAREADARTALLQPQREALARELADCKARMAAAGAALGSWGDGDGPAAREAVRAGERLVATLMAEAEQARARLGALARDVPATRARRDEARARAAELGERLSRTAQARDDVADAPAVARMRLEHGSAGLTAAASAMASVSARLQEGQAGLRAARAARRGAEAAQAAAREAIRRSEAEDASTEAALAEIEARLREDGLRVEATAGATAAAEAEARRRVARAQKAREEIGPVNLLADREAGEVGQRLAALEQEAGELDEAVRRLRGSIGRLNKEGRERLSASFVQIDQQFRALFSRMFDGGRAHLAMVGSDDPLEAGLEIYAQPPGKKLAALSLLSGGEQALTALSLIFAAFRCNPAPVCVLDEVDAPLDDANVERFCRLVSDMAKETGTRFLVVTHHQLTMASMDRLYGVTMQERGVSRLLSVDLGRAVEIAGV